MTRDDAKRIMENLTIISHYAAGGDIEYPVMVHDGSLAGWHASKNMNICCLGRYRIVGATQKASVKFNVKQLPIAKE